MHGQAYAGSMFDQINRNSSAYLPGGKVHRLFNPDSDAEADAADEDVVLRRIHMRSTPVTSDDMERVFGVYKFALESVPNLALTTAGGMTCYRYVLVQVGLGFVQVRGRVHPRLMSCRYNRTSEWLRGLPLQLRDVILTIARRMHTTTMHERKANLKAASDGKFRRQAAAAAKQKLVRKRMIRNLLRYESVEVFTSTDAWEA